MAQSAPPWLRIGTRGSPLALAQAHEVRDRLAAAHGIAPENIELQIIRTSGDRIQDRPLSEVGGKGLFTKEIEEALAAGTLDLAVHSAKDMPRLLPDLKIVTFRGNVQTRLRKLDEGEVDATLLALAGLKRLGLTEHATSILDIEEFLPAVGQGAIAIETREDDSATRKLLATINHPPTEMALAAERAFLTVLDGSCRTPIAGHARLSGGELHFRGLIARPDGSESLETSRSGT